MEAAPTIRQALDGIALLRAERAANAALGESVTEVKRFQSMRFAGEYQYLLVDERYRAAAGFFLEELYGVGDFSARDDQFARIAGAIQRVFPAQVAATAAGLAKLHALTEALDHEMGRAWLTAAHLGNTARYIHAWRIVGRHADRRDQLKTVLEVGAEMVRLTRTPGLRTMLKMMRAPAAAAGLRSLQAFLETGFDRFAGMSRRSGTAEEFLATIAAREAEVIEMLFEADLVACETRLMQTLGQAR